MNSSVRCSHILQKHINSRNPVDSYRNVRITRTPDQAIENIMQIRKEILEKGLKSFGLYAQKYSECRSAAQGGDLGQFGRNEMQKPFEDAAFELKVGEMSEPVVTDSGVHILFRTA